MSAADLNDIMLILPSFQLAVCRIRITGGGGGYGVSAKGIRLKGASMCCGLYLLKTLKMSEI